MDDISDSTNTIGGGSSEVNRHAVSHKVQDEDRRIRRVFIHLSSLCLTEEAKASLKEFQMAYEAKEGKGSTTGVAIDTSLREKTSFFDKLRAKRKISG